MLGYLWFLLLRIWLTRALSYAQGCQHFFVLPPGIWQAAPWIMGRLKVVRPVSSCLSELGGNLYCRPRLVIALFPFVLEVSSPFVFMSDVFLDVFFIYTVADIRRWIKMWSRKYISVYVYKQFLYKGPAQVGLVLLHCGCGLYIYIYIVFLHLAPSQIDRNIS